MLADATRLHDTVDQVLKAGVARERAKGQARAVVDVAALTRECVDLATVRGITCRRGRSTCRATTPTA